MSFVDNLMDMLKNGKEEDGAATARENLSQTWGYPSLVAALPYRYYDDINEIFVNAALQASSWKPPRCPARTNEQVMAALDDMLRKNCPARLPSGAQPDGCGHHEANRPSERPAAARRRSRHH
jgi:conjugal transfer ATP-binding protein TraC